MFSCRCTEHKYKHRRSYLQHFKTKKHLRWERECQDDLYKFEIKRQTKLNEDRLKFLLMMIVLKGV
jgi:hypothetical protein